jgi:hypothetical protein
VVAAALPALQPAVCCCFVAILLSPNSPATFLLQESHWLSSKCGRQLGNCSAEAQRQYVVEVSAAAVSRRR